MIKVKSKKTDPKSLQSLQKGVEWGIKQTTSSRFLLSKISSSVDNLNEGIKCGVLSPNRIVEALTKLEDDLDYLYSHLENLEYKLTDHRWSSESPTDKMPERKAK